MCSGGVYGKKKQWIIIPEIDTAAATLPIPPEDVKAYQESGTVQIHGFRDTRKKKQAEDRFTYTDNHKRRLENLDEKSRDKLLKEVSERAAAKSPNWANLDAEQRKKTIEPMAIQEMEQRGDACFYVQWNDADGTPHVSFGHTPHFRLPYRNTTAKAVPKENQREKGDDRWDMAQAIFGRPVNEKPGSGRRGRVFFEDAMLTSPEPGTAETNVNLATPKPTTYQHYLVQRSTDVAGAIHWDGDYRGSNDVPIVVRGHKLYWHRRGTPLPDPSDDQRLASSFNRVLAGAVFVGHIRFENLTGVELGLLLTALDLPDKCAHKLGMGKALGLGSFRITLVSIRETKRDTRYASFFAAPQAETNSHLLETGGADGLPNIESYRRAFVDWYKPEGGDFWNDPRLAELKALLTFDNDHGNDWQHMTRYLEFGSIDGYNNGRSYNEYLNVGYPNVPQPEKRRPLPPATQVLEGGPKIPRDRRPPLHRRKSP